MTNTTVYKTARAMLCNMYIYNDLPIPEFFILLHRSQNSRMDDQRGLLDQKNIELPDFLKIQETPKKRNDPLLVGVPSPRPAHHPLEKTISSPPSYATRVSKPKGSTKPDPLGDAGYESTTDDEGVTRNFPKAEVIVPQGNANSDQLAVSGSVVPLRSCPTSQYFCENMATAKRHVHTLAEPSTSHALKSGNDRQAILDNSFLRDQLKPSRLFSQLSAELNSPLKTSSPKERNGTPMKCPLFIPPGNSYTPGDDFTETGTCRARDNHVEAASIEPRVCWQANEPANEEGNVRVTFV